MATSSVGPSLLISQYVQDGEQCVELSNMRFFERRLSLGPMQNKTKDITKVVGFNDLVGRRCSEIDKALGLYMLLSESDESVNKEKRTVVRVQGSIGEAVVAQDNITWSVDVIGQTALGREICRKIYTSMSGKRKDFFIALRLRQFGQIDPKAVNMEDSVRRVKKSEDKWRQVEKDYNAAAVSRKLVQSIEEPFFESNQPSIKISRLCLHEDVYRVNREGVQNESEEIEFSSFSELIDRMFFTVNNKKKNIYELPPTSAQQGPKTRTFVHTRDTWLPEKIKSGDEILWSISIETPSSDDYEAYRRFGDIIDNIDEIARKKWVSHYLSPKFIGGSKDGSGFSGKEMFNRVEKLNGIWKQIEEMHQPSGQRPQRCTTETLACCFDSSSYCRLPRTVPMDYDQRDKYKNALKQAQKELQDLVENKGFDGARDNVLAAIIKLKQICGQPSPVDEGISCKKYEKLQELICDCLLYREKTAVVSQYPQMLKIIKRDLETRGVHCLYIDEETQDRQRLVDEFNGKNKHSTGQEIGLVNSRKNPPLLVSLGALNQNLGLDRLDTVINYDVWEGNSEQLKALLLKNGGCLQRLYNVKAGGTIEGKNHQLQERTQKLISKVIGSDENVVSKLTEKDLWTLLEQ